MDASCKIQRSIHDVRLTYKYVSRILGTYHISGDFLLKYFIYVNFWSFMHYSHLLYAAS